MPDPVPDDKGETKRTRRRASRSGGGSNAATSIPHRSLRWTVISALAGIAAVIVALVTLFWQDDEPPRTPPPAQSTGPITQGDEACVNVGTGNTCTIEREADELSKNAADAQQLREALAAVSQSPPQGAGPWPFMAYDTRDGAGNDIGLKINAAPTLAGTQIGSARGRSLLWADCYVMNDFKPVPDGSRNDVGPKWLRVHWPTGEPGSGFRDASATDQFTGYAYAGYALPFYHNGEIPPCT